MSSSKTITKRLIIRHWAGEINDLYDIIDQVNKSIPSSELIVELDVQVGDVSISSNDAKEIKQIPKKDLEKIRQITSRSYTKVGGRYGTPYVNVKLDKTSPVMIIEIHSDDENFAEGVHTRLKNSLKNGERWLGRDRLLNLGSILLMPTIFASVWLGPEVAHKLGLASTNGRWDPAEIAGMIILFLTVGLLYGWLLWLMPNLEIIDSSMKTRMTKWKGWLVTAVMAIILGVVSSLLYDFIH
jgi:hypothetical protein